MAANRDSLKDTVGINVRIPQSNKSHKTRLNEYKSPSRCLDKGHCCCLNLRLLPTRREGIKAPHLYLSMGDKTSAADEMAM